MVLPLLIVWVEQEFIDFLATSVPGQPGVSAAGGHPTRLACDTFLFARGFPPRLTPILNS
jgi:hypothetical protein